MEPEIQSQQPSSKNNQTVLTVVISVLAAAIIFGLGAYILAKNSFNNEKQMLEQKISTLQTQIDEFKATSGENTSPVTTSTDTSNIDNTFVNLSKELLRRDSKVTLTPTTGYLITTSIVSNNGSKVVYSEISDCIKAANGYGADGQTCNWKYNVFVKDLQTGKLDRIYSYPKNTSFFQNLQKLIVSEVKAGGCQLVYFPIAWSKNDQKIILQWGNPTSCGSGGAPQYLTYTLSPAGGSLENLSTYSPVFLDNYNKVVFIDESVKSPSECGPVAQTNYGKIVLKYVETGKTVILLEETNSSYSSLKTNSNQTVLSYSVKKVKDVSGCSEVDSSVAEKTGQVQIP